MECPICGKPYSVTHECSGPQKLSEREAAPPPAGFAPLYYLRLAFSIMRWDDVSVRRASRDSRASLYGAFVWITAAALVALPTAFSVSVQGVRQADVTDRTGILSLIFTLLALFVVVVAVAIVFVIQLAACHLVAKWFFGGSGTFAGILRPLLLGWPINIVSIIPIIGPLVAALLCAAIALLVVIANRNVVNAVAIRTRRIVLLRTSGMVRERMRGAGL